MVWMFVPDMADIIQEADLETESPFKGPYTRVYVPRQTAARIRAQGGVFTVHKYIKERQDFVPLEKNRRCIERLTKVLIRGDWFCEIRAGLDRYMVNDASLFPDLDGVCRHLKWLHERLDDEKKNVPPS